MRIPGNTGTGIVVFDMAHLMFCRANGLLTVSAPHVGVLAQFRCDDSCSDREAVFRVLDVVLCDVELPSADDSWCKVGLYNPLTFQIAFGAIPATVVFGDGFPIVVNSCGTVASISASGSSLLVAGRNVPVSHVSMREAQHALAAHR